MMSEPDGQSRRTMARETARRLVDGLEVENLPMDQCLMMAQRLARLMRDQDAQTWLALEMRGYREDFDLQTLGTCRKYCWRDLGKGKVYTPSLPHIEAAAKSAELLLGKLQAPSISSPVENHTVKAATQAVISTMTATLAGARDQVTSSRSTFSRMKAGLHEYATEALIGLELGDVAEELFDVARIDVDVFVRARCPKAVDQLLAVSDGLRKGDPESLSAALTSCRRVLNTVADAVFPARENYKDSAGRTRKVGTEQYVNRLLAYIDVQLKSGSTRAIVETHLEHLAARLDALYAKVCKAVHADVDKREASLAVIETYLFLAEVARASSVVDAATPPEVASSDDGAD